MKYIPVVWKEVAKRLRQQYRSEDRPLSWQIIDRLAALEEAEGKPSDGPEEDRRRDRQQSQR
ncbi:MAG: hypothetical protein JSS20_16220 [Proteobacteria bacterium]|nr:hypothetical protein [Pseudomonadota bacterium]